MKIANILIDSNKKSDENKALSIERSFIEYALYLTKRGAEVLSVFKADEFYREASIESSSQVLELSSKKFHKIYLVIQLCLKFLDFLRSSLYSGKHLPAWRIIQIGLMFSTEPFSVLIIFIINKLYIKGFF